MLGVNEEAIRERPILMAARPVETISETKAFQPAVVAGTVRPAQAELTSEKHYMFS